MALNIRPGAASVLRMFAGDREVREARYGGQRGWWRELRRAWTGTAHQSPSVTTSAGGTVYENLLTNPRLGTGTAGGWSAYLATYSVVSTRAYVIGGYALEVTQNGDFDGRVFTTARPAEAGVEYQASAWVTCDTAVTLAVDMFPYDNTTGSGATITSYATTNVTIQPGVWTRLDMVQTMPSGTLSVRLVVRMRDTASTAAKWWLGAGMLARAGSRSPDYFDGATPTTPGSATPLDFTWAGTPSASHSIASAYGAEVSRNIMPHPGFEGALRADGTPFEWAAARMGTWVGDTTYVRSGTRSLKLSPSDVGSYVLVGYQDKPSNRVTMRAWVYAEVPTNVRLWLWCYTVPGTASGEGGTKPFVTVPAGQWTEIVETWTLTDTTGSVRPAISMDAIGDVAWVDDVWAGAAERDLGYTFDGDTPDRTG